MIEQGLLSGQSHARLPFNDRQHEVLFIGKVMVQLAFTDIRRRANVVHAGALNTLLIYQPRGLRENTLTTTIPSWGKELPRHVDPLSSNVLPFRRHKVRKESI